MHSITALLAAEHLHDLMREADRGRLASQIERDGSARPPAWRRLLGRGARRLSVGLDAAAARLDPDELRRLRDEGETGLIAA